MNPQQHPKHSNYHGWAKVAATEALSGAINHIRDVHGADILDKFPNLLSDLTAAYSRVYAAHVVADAIRETKPEHNQ